jgi:UrcA family protein
MRCFAPKFATPIMLTALCFGAHADASTDGPASRITGRSVVYYGDIDLSVEQDAKIMLQRIERAAKTACGGHATVSSITGSVDRYTFEECRARAVQGTVKRLDASLVMRIYSETKSR